MQLQEKFDQPVRLWALVPEHNVYDIRAAQQLPAEQERLYRADFVSKVNEKKKRIISMR